MRARLAGIAALGALGVWPVPAPAQSADPATPLPEVVVTGGAGGGVDGGRETLTAREARDLQVRTAQDLNGLAPNVVYENGGDRSYNGTAGARGLVNSFYFTDPALTLYVDDVPFAFPFMNRLDGDSVRRLEILQGPQGFLGQNGPAGIVSVTQDQPTDAWTAAARNDYGSYQYFRTFEQAAGPVAKGEGRSLDGLASVRYAQRDGYLRNTADDSRPDGRQEIAGRLAFRWAEGDRLTLSLDLEQEGDHDGVQRFTPLGGPRYRFFSSVPGKSESQSGVQALKAAYDAGDGYRVVAISSHRSFRIDDLADIGFGAAPDPAEIKENPDQYMEELRVESTGDSDAAWSAGAAWQRVDLSPSVSLQPVPGALYRSALRQRFESYAAFGQYEFRPSDRLTLRVGDRVQFDARSADRGADLAGALYRDSENRQYLDTAPKAEAEYAVAAGSRLFASTGLTFRPGGYAPFVTATTLEPYGAEKTWANAAGWQAEAWDRRLSSTVTLFWNETYGYQLELNEFPTAGVETAPEVSSRGAEWSLEGRPLPELTLEARLGLDHATFDRFRDPGTGRDFRGNRVPSVPEETLLLGATYRHRLGWLAHVDYRWFGQTDYDPQNSPAGTQAGHGLLAARLGYETRHWSAYLYGENLGGASYAALIAPGLGLQVPGDPRTAGAGLDLKW